MPTTNGDFYGGVDAALTAEQAAEAMRLAESGDTSHLGLEPGTGPTGTTAGSESDKGSTTTTDELKTGDAATTTKDAATGAAAIPEDQQTAANTTILARDGKHTIGFDQLEKARRQRDDTAAALQLAQSELATLRAQAEQRAAQGQAPTKMDNLTAKAEEAIAEGADPELFGDFSEAAMVKGITTLVNRLVPQIAEKVVGDKLAPIQQREAQTAANAHEAEIFAAHPNALDIVQSTEFKAWVESMPKAAQAGIWAQFDAETGGTATEIVDTLNAYTKSSAAPKGTPTAAAPASAAAATAPKGIDPPISLTGIPGGRADANTPNERIAEMDGASMMHATEHMTAAQLEAFLNQQL